MKKILWQLCCLAVAVLSDYCVNCEYFRVVSLSKSGQNSFKLIINNNSRRQEFNLVRRTLNVKTIVINENATFDSSNEENTPDNFYEDPDHDASVVIEKIDPNERAAGVYSISGVLGNNLIISPAGSNSPRNRNSKLTGLRLVKHNVTRRQLDESMSGGAGADYMQLEPGHNLAVSRSRQGKSLSSRSKVFPEILVIVDYSLFKKFKFNSHTARKYIVTYFNAVNMRFRTFFQPRIELQIAGILFGKSKSSFPFLSSSISKGDMLDAPSALHLMGQYYYKHRSELPVFDMVVTLTGLDMARMKNGEMSRSNTGYAYVGGACVRNSYLGKISSVALVEDSGGYSGVVVTAHEIGHLLGAVHDGDPSPSYLRGPGAKSCPWSDGYIMSDLRRTSRGVTWSQCSVKQIKYFLSTSTAQCLYNAPAASSQYSLPGDSLLPGQDISLDDQCRQDRGTRACYHDHRVCSQLFCYTNNYSGCYAFRPAAEGSKCGNNKMCINGKCIRKKAISQSRTESHNSHNVMEEQADDDDKDGDITESSTTAIIVTTASTAATGKSYTSTITTTIKIDDINDEQTRIITKKDNKSKSFKNNATFTAPRMPKQNHVSVKKETKNLAAQDCEDSLKVLGSLTCPQLFQRYAFHYCKNSRVIKKKCCVSYQKFCVRNYP